MVELLIGKKGTGKTKVLIENVNNAGFRCKRQRRFHQQQHWKKYV